MTAEKDGDIAYVGVGLERGHLAVGLRHARISSGKSTDILRGSVFTDRGVYKPGEQVHVKAIVRADTPTGVRLLPAGSTIDVRVHDGRGPRSRSPIDHAQPLEQRRVDVDGAGRRHARQLLRSSAMLPGTERPAGNDAAPRERRDRRLAASR